MCGITGAVFKSSQNSFPIRQAADLLKHRGPDDEGYILIEAENNNAHARSGKDTRPEITFPSIESAWPSIRAVLAHRRLSILDLSASGHQPMTDSESAFWIVHNGEIYNYKELRDELESSGVRFRSKTDTEVILEAYKKWGKNCLSRFNGMWAFAIWDVRKKELFCARDRFGVKPFYYSQANGHFIFASEIKALFAYPGVKYKPSEKAIWEYLALTAYPRGEDTFFDGIKQLEAGACLTVDEKAGVRKEKWYRIPQDLGDIHYNREAVEEFYGLLDTSIRLRLRSDVPVGTCLSGGLDSSSIACLMSRSIPDPVHVFSSCFEDKAYDERKFINSVCDKIKTEKHFVFPNGKNFWQEIESVIYHQDEPFGSTSIYAQWCVMREAAGAKVPVLLDGQGADELLGGYKRYEINRAISRFNHADLLAAIENPLTIPASLFLAMPLSLRKGIVQFLPYGSYLRKEAAEKFSDVTGLYVAERSEGQKSLNQTLLRDFTRYKLPVLLRHEDRNSMRFSVETRLPFLDFRLVEFSMRLEERAKIDDVSKKILRDSMKGILPPQIQKRRDKMGFVTPDKEWFNDAGSFLKDLFSEPGKNAIAPWVNTQKLKDRFEKGGKWDLFFWRAVNLELWLKVFLKKDES